MSSYQIDINVFAAHWHLAIGRYEHQKSSGPMPLEPGECSAAMLIGELEPLRICWHRPARYKRRCAA
jgi:hypothetical protein